MDPKAHARLLETATDAETFVRSALALLEADHRELALRALADWDALGVVSTELFHAVLGLQRPSWGSWNGLLAALRNARKAVLRTGTPADRERVGRAGLLNAALDGLEEAVPADVAVALRPLAERLR